MKIGHDAMVALHNLTEGKCKSEEERHQAFATCILMSVDEKLVNSLEIQRKCFIFAEETS